MTMLIDKPRYTADDLLTRPELEGFELVNGRLVERNVGTESSWVGGELHALLRNFCREHRAGWVLPADTSYQCFPDDPERVRRPDVSVVLAGRFPDEKLPKGHARIPPDLAVEVVSPNDIFVEVRSKVREYLDAGVRLVWVLEPETRTVEVHDGTTPALVLSSADELTGGDVLPTFRCRVADLFSPTAPVEEPAS